MLKKDNGITLIALIITIIVLIILAAVVITSFTGDHSVLDTAQKARTSEAYSSAKDLEQLSFSSLRASIVFNASTDSTYDARGSSTSDTNPKALMDAMSKELNDGSYYFALGSYADERIIYIVHVNTAIDSGIIQSKKEGATDNVPRYRKYVFSTITLKEQTATFAFDIEKPSTLPDSLVAQKADGTTDTLAASSIGTLYEMPAS